MKSLRLLLAAAMLALVACAANPPATAQPARAAPPPQGIAEVTTVEGITEYRLPNGLQLLLVPDPSKPSTTVNLTFRVGSRHENYGETGMAHLLEHLIFKGTPTTRNALGEFSKRGLRANGTTSSDRTNYFASFTANDESLAWYIGWLADAMVNSFIAKEDLASEMTVVRNEMEMGENNPGRVLFQRTLAAMYDWHNYGNSTIGARADVENVDISRLQAFYKLHYQPDNATLIVTGRFEPAMVLKRVAQTFGPMPRPTRALAPTYTLDPAQDGERTVNVRRVGAAPLIYMAHHVPPGPHVDSAAAALLGQVLGDTPGGRLHKRLVQTQLAAGAFGFSMTMTEPGAFLVGAQLAPGQDVDKARTEMAAVVDGLKTEPVTAEELERARTQWLNSWEQGFTDPEVIGGQLSEAIALGDWRLYFLERDHVRKVSLADINRVAVERLKSDNRTVGIYRPLPPGTSPDRAPAPAKVDVAALVKDYKGDANVALAEAFDATPANLDRRNQISQLASGMRVALLPKGTRGRAVQARLMLHYGDEKSLFGQETVGSFVGTMFDKGGAGLTRQQIADRFDKLRAQVAWQAADQVLTVTVDTVREHLPATIELIGELLRKPDFPVEPIEEHRRRLLAALEQQRREPANMVANAVDRHGNPYPRGDLRHTLTFDEQAEDIQAVKPEQLRGFHRRFYSVAKSEFAAVGDLDAAAVKRSLDVAFGDWRVPAGGSQPYIRVPRPLVNVPPLRVVLAAPDKQNANLMAVLALPLNDSHPDYPAVTLAGRILGGTQNSRLWSRIRETAGLSYDVAAYVQWASIDPNSRWVSTAIFAPQNQPKVESIWREEMQRSVTAEFTQAELDEARNNLLNLRRLSRAQDAVVAGAAAAHLHLGRTFAFDQRIDDRLAAVTLAQVNAAWRKYFDPGKLVVGWGGDFKETAAKAP